MPEPAPANRDFRDFYVESFQPIVRALALTIGDDRLASEATAEAMTRAFERWNKVGDYENPGGWVYRVALNWSKRRFRRSWREVITAEPPDTHVSSRDGVDTELVDALAALSEDQRSVVVLRYLFDWSEEQTAAALDIAPGTAKSRLSRGLKRLSELLEVRDAS